MAQILFQAVFFSQLAILMADSRLSLYFLRWLVGVSYMNVLYHLSFGVRVGHYVKTVKLERSQSKRVYVAGSSLKYMYIQPVLHYIKIIYGRVED